MIFLTLVAGVGNVLRGDDAVGVQVILELISDGVGEKCTLLDCGVAPESFIGVFEREKNGKIIIIDAVDMGLSPGAVEIVDTNKIAGILFSTHKLPLGMTLKYLEKTEAEVVFIGVQPKATGFGVEMSEECKNAISVVKEIVISEI